MLEISFENHDNYNSILRRKVVDNCTEQAFSKEIFQLLVSSMTMNPKENEYKLNLKIIQNQVIFLNCLLVFLEHE